MDATYAQPMGETATAQPSIRRWTGLTAEPLLAKTYDYMIDQKLGTRVDGDFLRLRVKDEFKSFSLAARARVASWIGASASAPIGSRISA